jgi:hypothetical protein
MDFKVSRSSAASQGWPNKCVFLHKQIYSIVQYKNECYKLTQWNTETAIIRNDSRRVGAKRKSCCRKSITLLEGTQASPARLSSKDSSKVKTLWWYEVVALDRQWYFDFLVDNLEK